MGGNPEEGWTIDREAHSMSHTSGFKVLMKDNEVESIESTPKGITPKEIRQYCRKAEKVWNQEESGTSSQEQEQAAVPPPRPGSIRESKLSLSRKRG